MLPVLTTLLALVLPAVPPAPVQDSGSDTPAVEATKAEPKARATVLHLEGGQVLRTKAREREDGWEVLQGGEWTLLPTSLVQRAVNEHDLLEQAAKLERALPRKDLVRRVAYADWLVTEGLFVEGLKQVDRVLQQDPDQADALALLARADVPLALPPTPRDAATLDAFLDAFFTGAARSSEAGRELAVRRLADAHGIPGLQSALSQELYARTPARRSFATLALRRLFAGAEAKPLLGRAVLDSSDEVRAGAALALKDFADPGVIEPVVKALGSKIPEVRANAVKALERMDYREAVEPLFTHLTNLASGGGGYAPRVHIFNGTQRSYVQDFDVEVAQGQAIADPIINVLVEGSVLDVAVVGVKEYVVANERATVRRALSALTGAEPGDTTVAWQRWWSEHGAEWRAGEIQPKAPTTPSGKS